MKENYFLIYKKHMNSTVSFLNRPGVQKIEERASETLIDVILTNLPDGFIKRGVFDPGLSDHAPVNPFMKERVVKFKTKVVNFRSCKNFDEQVVFKECDLRK